MNYDERGTMASVDSERYKMIDQMNDTQKDMFIIGMCYHAAHFTFLEIQAGKEAEQSHNCIKELEATIEAMNRQGLKTLINE
jgi:hypothetical protein